MLAGAAATWPLAARAQQPAMPVVGFIRPSPPESVAHLLPAFRAGLKEIGFVEGQNVVVEYRFGDTSTSGFQPWRLNSSAGR